MTMSYKPGGYNSASPYLIVNGADRAMEFLARAFDAVEGWPPVPSHVHLYVADVDEAYRRALECGGESVRPPAREG
ncbi:MAG TPA: hypothetical protein VE913_14205, partial [Longimicrobium sp.]|nr:hypothetical protein [Longimicrobium sp.]